MFDGCDDTEHGKAVVGSMRYDWAISDRIEVVGCFDIERVKGGSHGRWAFQCKSSRVAAQA